MNVFEHIKYRQMQLHMMMRGSQLKITDHLEYKATISSGIVIENKTTKDKESYICTHTVFVLHFCFGQSVQP